MILVLYVMDNAEEDPKSYNIQEGPTSALCLAIVYLMLIFYRL